MTDIEQAAGSYREAVKRVEAAKASVVSLAKALEAAQADVQRLERERQDAATVLMATAAS